MLIGYLCLDLAVWERESIHLERNEKVTSHLMPHLSLRPTLRTCSSDTILRAISELATANTTYTSDTGKSYDFNTATRLNRLLVKALLNTGQLMAGASYDLDFDHQFIETEKCDAKMTYKKFTGYSPGSASLLVADFRYFLILITGMILFSFSGKEIMSASSVRWKFTLP